LTIHICLLKYVVAAFFTAFAAANVAAATIVIAVAQHRFYTAD
jgi:hypothetical protein